jgi:hypothetical protein
MAEEKIKLSLDYGESKKDTVDVAGALDKVKSAASAVGNDAFAELIGKSSEMVTKLKETAASAKEGGEKTKLGLADIAAGAGGLFAAFTSGNIGGVIKGVSGIVDLIPALNTFAPAIKLAGEMADTAWPLLKEWYEYLGKANLKIVESAKSLDDYTEALRNSDAQLKESDELAKARAADKAAGGDVSNKQKDRAQTFTDLTKGRQEETLKEVFEAVHGANVDFNEAQIEGIRKKYAAYRAEALARNPNAESGIIGQSMKTSRDMKERAEIDKFKSGENDQKEAEGLLEKARAGDAKAIDRLRAILPEGSTTRDVARLASPEAQDEAREGKRDVADQQKRFADRQKQDQARAAAGDHVQARIKQDIEAQSRKAIERSESASRGQAVKDAEKEAVKKFFAGGESTRGMGQRRPGSASAAQQESILNRMRAASSRKARPRPGASRNPTREQERSGPPQLNGKLIRAMEAVTANQAGAAQNDAQRIEQIIQSARNTGNVQATNRSAASSGFAS